MEIREKILAYFGGDELATDVFLSKYSLNNVESPLDMHKRMAKEFARIEEKYPITTRENLSEYGKIRKPLTEERILELFDHFNYIVPQGSVMAGLGSKSPVSLSNCYVLPSPEDNIESIMNTGRDSAQIYKRRGGVGYDISELRPSGVIVDNASKTSTGPISFMEYFSTVTNTICQQGRRGATMISIDINHPDSPEFAIIKRDLTKVTGANISIRLNQEFIDAVKNNEDYILRYPCNFNIKNVENQLINRGYAGFTDLKYNKLIHIKSTIINAYIKKVRAEELWNTIVESNWLSAEPGIFNFEHLINYDPTSVYSELRPISTNPCGELPLSGFDSCRLILSNLYSLVDKPFTENAYFDEKKAYQIFYETQVLADNLVDLEIEAVERILTKIDPEWLNDYSEFKKSTETGSIKNENYWLVSKSEEFKLWWKIREIGSKGRRTGSGITAYGDMMAALGLPYGDPKITKKVFALKLKAELDASIDMAVLRGPFSLWDNKEASLEDDFGNFIFSNKWYEFIHDTYFDQFLRMTKYGRRNAGLSTIAPAGSVSILTQTTSGIEPLFMPYYTRRKKCNPGEKPDFVDQNGVGFKEFFVLHPKFKDWVIIQNNTASETKFLQRYDLNNKQDIEDAFKKSPWFNQTSDKLNLATRIETQALVQKYITSSISSTCNVPATITKEEMGQGYLLAFEKGCKGLTYYRDGSRSGILVNEDTSIFKSNNAPKRPKELKANLHLTKSRGNTYAVIIGLLENKPYEVFVFNIFDQKISECNGKIIKVKQGHYRFESVNLIIDNLNDSGNSNLEKACALYTSMLLRHGADIHYVVKTAKKIDDGITSFVSAMNRILNKYDTVKEEGICPECGGRLIKEGGCEQCKDCGYSRC